ncbi:YxiJ family protein [Paenibacillus sp. Z6-24]
MSIQTVLEEIQQLYTEEYETLAFYEEWVWLQQDFAEEFKQHAADEIINADFGTYESLIVGLASRRTGERLADALERYKYKQWLEKSFYDCYPKYRFLERYDLSGYPKMHKTMMALGRIRMKLLQLVRLLDSSAT